MTGIEGFITKKPLQSIEYRGFKVCLVPVAGLEPALPKKPDFESSVSTNSTTLAFLSHGCVQGASIAVINRGSTDLTLRVSKISSVCFSMNYLALWR